MIEKKLDTNFVFESSIRNDERTSSAGLMGRTVCIPDESGDYRPFREEADDSWDALTPNEYDVSYHYLAVSCPRFRKCDECPNKSKP